MKKLIFGACTAILFMASACSTGNDADNTFKVSKERSDSVCAFFGQSAGGYVLNDFTRFGEEFQTEQTKKDMIKGIQLALANCDNHGVAMGIQIGSQLAAQLERMKEMGVEVDRNLFLKNFIQVFESEGMNFEKLHEANSTVTTLMTKIETEKELAEAAKAAEEAEAVDAATAGKEFIEEAKKQDPAIQTSESGLSYKIENPGTEPKANEKSLVTVNYVGKLIDGTVFDQSKEGEPVTFSPSGVIPGFAEGLQLLGKGGKATLYIPGELAYGVNGVPQAGIAPNATLIFEIEVVDIQNN